VKQNHSLEITLVVALLSLPFFLYGGFERTLGFLLYIGFVVFVVAFKRTLNKKNVPTGVFLTVGNILLFTVVTVRLSNPIVADDPELSYWLPFGIVLSRSAYSLLEKLSIASIISAIVLLYMLWGHLVSGRKLTKVHYYLFNLVPPTLLLVHFVIVFLSPS